MLLITECFLTSFLFQVWFLTRALDGLLLYNGGKPAGGGDFICLNLVQVCKNKWKTKQKYIKNMLNLINWQAGCHITQNTEFCQYCNRPQLGRSVFKTIDKTHYCYLKRMQCFLYANLLQIVTCYMLYF